MKSRTFWDLQNDKNEVTEQALSQMLCISQHGNFLALGKSVHIFKAQFPHYVFSYIKLPHRICVRILVQSLAYGPCLINVYWPSVIYIFQTPYCTDVCCLAHVSIWMPMNPKVQSKAWSFLWSPDSISHCYLTSVLGYLNTTNLKYQILNSWSFLQSFSFFVCPHYSW